MSITAPAIIVTTNANLVELHDHHGSAKVSYYATAPGSQLSFRGPQVSHTDTLIGELVTVTLEPQSDAGSFSYSILLLPLDLGTTKEQNFETVAVKALLPGNLHRLGAQISYQTECLTRKAELLPLTL